MQPVATALVVPATAETTATPGNAGAASAGITSLAIGDQVKARGKPSLPTGGDQTAATPGTSTNVRSDASSSSPVNGNAAAASASSPASGNGPAGPQPDGTASASSAQAPTSTATWAPVDSIESAGAPPAARADGQGTTATDGAASSTIPLGANAALKPETAGLTNLGIAVANTASASTGATPAVAPNTTPATVPIAGLPIAIASRALGGSNQFDIKLDPPELGRIEVRLDVSNDGQVTSHVTVDRPDTLSLLQSQQPQLERALEQAGLKTADNGLQFSLRDQSFSGQNNGGNGNAAQTSSAQLVIPDNDLPVVDATQAYSRIRLGGGIDIRV